MHTCFWKTTAQNRARVFSNNMLFIFYCNNLASFESVFYMKTVQSRLFKNYLKRRKSRARICLSLGWLNIGEKNERAKNGPKWQILSVANSISGTIFHIWSSFMVHMCKKWPKMTKNYAHHAPYHRKHTSYDCHLWCTCVKWWYLQLPFLFFRNFDFSGC